MRDLLLCHRSVDLYHLSGDVGREVAGQEECHFGYFLGFAAAAVFSPGQRVFDIAQKSGIALFQELFIAEAVIKYPDITKKPGTARYKI